jgi:hypothetical protein
LADDDGAISAPLQSLWTFIQSSTSSSSSSSSSCSSSSSSSSCSSSSSSSSSSHRTSNPLSPSSDDGYDCERIVEDVILNSASGDEEEKMREKEKEERDRLAWEFINYVGGKVCYLLFFLIY